MDSEANDREVHVDNISFTPVLEVQEKDSEVWFEFSIVDGKVTESGKRRAQCIHCKKAFLIPDSRCGTSVKMKIHLKKCKVYQESLELSGKDHNFDQRTYKELVARAIIKHGYDFSWVEDEDNKEIHAYLNNQVRSICSDTAESDCLKLHASLKTQLKDTLRNVPGRICITSDILKSCQTEGYLCLTAHYVDANWKLNSKVLNFCPIESRRPAIYGAVLNLLLDWGIENKIFSITLDNASSDDKVHRYLRNALNNQGFLLSRGLFFHVRCAADVLDLMVKDGLKVIEHCVFKIRESVKYVKGSEVKKSAFRQCVKLAGIVATSGLWLDVPSKWDSTFLMLDRALLYRNAFKELAWSDPMFKYFLKPQEWELVEKIRDILEPFVIMTELFSGIDYPTANLYFENMWRIAMLLKELMQSKDDVLKNMAIDMKIKFDEYWDSSGGDDYTTLFAFAVVLDPRFKLPFLKFCYKRLFDDETKALGKVINVQAKLAMLFNEYAPHTSNTSCGTSLASNADTNNRTSGNHKRKYDYLADFEKEAVKTKLDIYLEEARVDRKTELNVLGWWKENEKQYGELSQLARDVLSVPLTTVASDSTFTIGGRILKKWRSSYLPENVEALVTARSWLYGYESIEEDEFFGSIVDWNTPEGFFD